MSLNADWCNRKRWQARCERQKKGEVRMVVRRKLPKQLRKKCTLVEIFGRRSIVYALAVCLRLQRWKGRTAEYSIGPEQFSRRPFPSRNYHHMTPQARDGQPHYGTHERNMLLIDVMRHRIWHEVFKLQTLEETIAMLAEYIGGMEISYLVYFLTSLCEIEAWQQKGRPNKVRKRLHSLEKFSAYLAA
jgi:hypothetical protein